MKLALEASEEATIARSETAHFTEELANIVGKEAVITSFEERYFYSQDFSEEEAAVALAVVKPANVSQVSSIVKLAAQSGVAVCVRGGAMSYTKGHVPVRADTVIIDATGLNRILEINTVDRYVTLETGVRWVDLRQALRGTGFRTPYIGTLSGNFATVGGGLSQNATGMGRVTLADHVFALEVVLGDGRILKTGSWVTKGTAPFYRYNGPDLTGMFLCDSGAFGVKTKVTLALEPTPCVSFGCVAFDDRIQLVKAQAELAQSGLQTEAFAFDGYFVNEFSKHPPPSKEEKRRMVNDFLKDHPNKWRAWRTLLRAWHPKGLKFLNGLNNIMYYSAEAHDQAAAARMEARIERIAIRNGGRRVPTTIPFGLRYGPFLNVGEIMANRDGEVNFPINAKFPASKAVQAMQAFEDFLAANESLLREHGIRVACNSLLHGHFWGIEPVIFWKRPLTTYRMHYATDDRRERSLAIEENEARTKAAIDFRYRLTRMFREMGSFHVQWAKAYPFADALEGETAWGFLNEVKSVTDPSNILNPGVLGLGLSEGHTA